MVGLGQRLLRGQEEQAQESLPARSKSLNKAKIPTTNHALLTTNICKTLAKCPLSFSCCFTGMMTTLHSQLLC